LLLKILKMIEYIMKLHIKAIT